AYSFITVSGIEYTAYFICCSNYDKSLENTFMFNFEHKGERAAKTSDPRIRETILCIIELFFQNNRNSMIYICDSLDGRELCRKRLFDIWGNECRDRFRHIHKEELHEEGEYYTLCSSLLVHVENPDMEQVIQSFVRLKEMLI
ncbi:DUF6169 family protein, partial [Dysgonomonas termitidis]